MGGVNSWALSDQENAIDATGKLEEICDNVFTKLLDDASVGGTDPAKNLLLLKMAISSLKSMDESVMKFISQCKKSILQDNDDIRNALSDASRKAKDAAREVQHHADLSIVQLENLKRVARMYSKGTEHSCKLALRELEQVNEKEIDLPQSLVAKLEEAMAAYENVLRICDKAVDHLKESREGLGTSIWIVVGCCCMMVLGVAICLLAPQAALAGVTISGVHISAAAAKAAALAIAFGIVRRVAVLVRIHFKIRDLLKSIYNRQQVLERAKRDTKQILLFMKEVRRGQDLY